MVMYIVFSALGICAEDLELSAVTDRFIKLMEDYMSESILNLTPERGTASVFWGVINDEFSGTKTTTGERVEFLKMREVRRQPGLYGASEFQSTGTNAGTSVELLKILGETVSGYEKTYVCVQDTEIGLSLTLIRVFTSEKGSIAFSYRASNIESPKFVYAQNGTEARIVDRIAASVNSREEKFWIVGSVRWSQVLELTSALSNADYDLDSLDEDIDDAKSAVIIAIDKANGTVGDE